MFSTKHTIESVALELQEGLRCGKVELDPRSPSVDELSPTQVDSGIDAARWAVPLASALLLFLGIAIGAAITGSITRSISGFDAPLLAILTPLADPNKGVDDGGSSEVRVRGALTFEVPDGCSLAVASPRRGFATLLWLDPPFEFPLQIFPRLGSIPDPSVERREASVGPEQPRMFADLPEVSRPTVAVVVVTPESALARIDKVANETVAKLGTAAHQMKPSELAQKVEEGLRARRRIAPKYMGSNWED